MSLPRQNLDETPALINLQNRITAVIEDNNLSALEIQHLLLTMESVIKILQNYQQKLQEEEAHQVYHEKASEAILHAYNYAKWHFVIERFNTGEWIDALFQPEKHQASLTLPKTNYAADDATPTTPVLAKKKQSFKKRLFNFFVCKHKHKKATADQADIEFAIASSSDPELQRAIIASLAETEPLVSKEQIEIPLRELEPIEVNLFGEAFREYLDSLEAKYHHHIKLFSKGSDNKSKHLIKAMLRSEGSLWDGSSPLGSFINLFLTQLRHTNIHVYRDLIESFYNIKLLKNERVLYRGDTRDHNVVFKEGFRLKPEANVPSMRKLAYCGSAGATGISMSHDKNVASNYGGGCYFTILLPKHHRLLISDFSFREVNSLEDIPREYIYSYHNHMNEEILNPYYQKDLVVASPTIRRGCY